MTSGKPRLLFLCQNLPYPPDNGAEIRSYHTLRLLAQRFDVTALCFFRKAIRPTDDAVRNATAGLSKLGEVHAFSIPQEHGRGRFLLDHVRSLLTARSYVRWTYESRRFRQRLEDSLSARTVDLIHLDSLDLMAYLPRVLDTGVPTVVAHHNVESQLLVRRAQFAAGWKRRYMELQAALTAREEVRWCPKVSLNIVVSSEDQAELSKLAPGARCLILPNGVDTVSLHPEPNGQRRGIVFLGSYSWFPNRDGMEYFTDHILPLIRSAHPDVPVTWIGRAPPDARETFAQRGITMTGYVDDFRPFVHAADCAVVPLRVGGGTRLKILDAWALGAAVVSTSAGAEGLQVRNGENLILADEPQSFADAVGRVLSDSALRARLGKGGRQTAVESYSWDSIGQRMFAAYERLLSS